MESSQPQERNPQRLSALYQYHNAPEVAPTQGLEYDDNVYPHSDKYPVIQQESTYSIPKYSGKQFEADNTPPRIIFGMKVRTFLLVALLVVGIVVGAAVGGAVGGRHMSETPAPNIVPTASTTSASPTTAVTSTFAAATPTYSPLSDCPNSNATLYKSSYSQRNFTKWCDFASPLTDTTTLSQAFVYSFNDCIELCASYRSSSTSSNATCSVAVYQPDAKRPANCFAGTAANGVDSIHLTGADNTDVALLDDNSQADQQSSQQ